MTHLLIYLAWIFQAAIGYWICRNSAAKCYWGGKENRDDFGADNFETVCEWGVFWNLFPVIGFLATYCFFITKNGKTDWGAFTLLCVKKAWTPSQKH